MRDMPRNGRRTAGAGASGRCSRSATYAGSRRWKPLPFRSRSLKSRLSTRGKSLCGRCRCGARRYPHPLHCGMPALCQSCDSPRSAHLRRNARTRRAIPDRRRSLSVAFRRRYSILLCSYSSLLLIIPDSKITCLLFGSCYTNFDSYCCFYG